MLGIPFTEVDIDQDLEGERVVLEANQGRRSVPTLVYANHAASMSRFSIVKLRTWLREAGLLSEAAD
jgi:mycoredoxin